MIELKSLSTPLCVVSNLIKSNRLGGLKTRMIVCHVTGMIYIPKDLYFICNSNVGFALILIFQTIFFLWFALSGWLFRVIIVATWVLPIAGPLLIGAVANNFVIKVYYTQPLLVYILRFSICYIMFGAAQGECPACKRQFIGYKNQVIRCEGCRNIVWQPQGDFFSRDGSNNSSSSNKGNSKKPPKSQIIDVDFEEK